MNLSVRSDGCSRNDADRSGHVNVDGGLSVEETDRLAVPDSAKILPIPDNHRSRRTSSLRVPNLLGVPRDGMLPTEVGPGSVSEVELRREEPRGLLATIFATI